MTDGSDGNNLEACIIHLTAENKDRWNKLMAAAVLATGHRLYAFLDGPGMPNTATQSLLRDIEHILQPVAYFRPRLDIVPLLKFASWSTDQVAKLQNVQTLLYERQHTHDAEALLQQLNQVREANNLPSLTLKPLADALPAPEPPELTPADSTPLSFEHVAVGGTFDRLHVGHRLLLAATALVTTQHVYIGITGASLLVVKSLRLPFEREDAINGFSIVSNMSSDQLLQKKAYKELLEPYDSRAQEAADYIKAVRPGLEVQTGALLDPKEPTAAAIDVRMQALVVSRETVPGAEEINEYRRNKGYPELRIVVVDLIADTQAVKGGKVSSTALREQDAAKQGKQAGA